MTKFTLPERCDDRLSTPELLRVVQDRAAVRSDWCGHRTKALRVATTSGPLADQGKLVILHLSTNTT